jgi:hypothetical protein
MLASSIKWILVISGILTAAGGLAALLLPQTTLRLVFGADNTSTLTEFFARHWGALLFVVCSLTIYAAFFSGYSRADFDCRNLRESHDLRPDLLR